MSETISDPQLALLRAPMHGTPRSSVLFWPLNEVGNVTITQSVYAFPLAEIAVDSPSMGWSNVRAGQLIRVFDTDNNLVMTNCVRKVPTSDTLYISAMGRGDPGAAQLVAVDLAPGFTVRVYDYQPLWSFRSRISSGVFYKFYDLPFGDQGTNPAPICNFGQWDHGFDLTGSGVSKSYNANPSRAWNGKSISSYQYVIVGPGYTVTSGALNTAMFTATFVAGFHLIYCTVTDSGGKSTTGVRPLWVTPLWGAGAPINTQEAVIQSEDRQDLQGRKVNYDLWGRHDLLDTVVYDGAALMQIDYATHGGEVLDPGVIIDRYVGFITDPQRTGTLQHTILTMQTMGPMLRLGKVGNATQAIIEADSPADWTQVQTGLGTPSFAWWYVLAYHCPNALALFDYNVLPEEDDTPVRKHSYGLTSQNVQAQGAEIMALVQGNLGAGSDGTFYFFRNPNMEDSGFRNAMETRMTLTSPIGTGIGDLKGDIVYPVTYPVPISTVTLGAFVIDAGDGSVAAFEAIAPDVTEAEGGTKQDGGSIIAASGDPDLLMRVGNLLAVLSSPTPNFSQVLFRNLDVADPARHYNTWFNIDIPARFDPRGVGYTARTLITAVQRDWKQQGVAPALKEITATITPETAGKPGKMLPQLNTDYVPPSYNIVDAPPFSNLAWACNTTGDFGATNNAQGGTTAWHSAKGVITGAVTDFDFDYHSPLLLSGFRYGQLGMWCVSVSGATVKVWYTPNVLATVPTWTNQATYTMADSSTVTQVRIAANRKTAQNAWVAWRTQTRTFAAKTIDGTSWDGSPTGVGTTFTDTGHDDAALGLAIEGDNVIVTAHTPVDLLGHSLYRPYWASALGGSFTTVLTYNTSGAPNPLIAAGAAGTLYVAADLDSTNQALVYYDGFFTGDNLISELAFVPTPEGTENWAYTCNADASPLHVFGLGADYATGTVAGTLSALFEMGSFDDWQATEIDVRFVIQSWNYALGTTFSFDYNIELLDKTMASLYSQTGTFGHTRTDNNISECGASTISLTGLSVDHVQYLRITASGSLDKTAPNQILWEGFDGVKVAVNRDFFYRDLYRVTQYEMSPATIPPPYWTAIPVTMDYIPRHPYALAVDGQSASIAWLADNLTTTRLYVSSDSGVTPVEMQSSVTYTGLRKSGNHLLLWGPSKIDISPDNGKTFQPRLGNWASAIGTPGTFLKVGAIA